MAKKAQKKVEETESVKKPSLKDIASGFRNYVNHEYQRAASYVPNSAEKASVTVNYWVELDEVLAEAMDMPGLPFGQLGQIYGKKDTGKSSFLQQAIVACQEQDILPILILSEHKFDFGRLKTWMNGDPEALLVFEVDNLEDGFMFMSKLLRDLKQGKLVIPSEDGEDQVMDMTDRKIFFFWDSIGGTDTQAILDDDVGEWDKDMGRSAQAYKKMVKRIYQLVHKVKDQAGVLFLNQVWGKRSPSGIVSDQPYGGEAVQHYFAYEIHLQRAQEIKMDVNKRSQGIGYDIKFNVKKNHITHTRPKTPLSVVAAGIIDRTEVGDFKKLLRKTKSKTGR